MKHQPWPFTARLVARMADSSLQDAGFSIKRAPRSEGLHASELLRLLHPRDEDNGITPEQLAIYGMLGLAFEDRCETALLSLNDDATWPFYAERPGEVEQDGIACSPDILLVPKDGRPFCELSIKCTWKSCADVPLKPCTTSAFAPKFDYYLDQCMTYATPLDTTASVLFVCFVNGDYRKNRNPTVHGWDLSYSERERAETWQALLNLKAQRESRSRALSHNSGSSCSKTRTQRTPKLNSTRTGRTRVKR